MEAVIRRKLAMAVRVRDFVVANPGQSPGYLSLSQKLEDVLARVEVVSIRQQDGKREEVGSLQYRQALRRRIHAELLMHIERVALRAARARPDLAGTFRRLRPDVPLNDFITNARALLASAGEEKELLIANGMSEMLIDDLTESIKEFDAATGLAHASRRDHVGAREQLSKLASEAIELVGLLDGIVRLQFRDNAELIAAWASASTVVRIHHTASEDGVTPAIPAPAVTDQGTPSSPSTGEKVA